MSDRIPELIDPYQLVEKNRGYKGLFSLSRLKRLLPSLVDSQGSVFVEIQFTRDANGQRVVTGSVKSDLMLECQRCMQVMNFSVDIKLSLGIVRTVTEAENLPDQYEPLLVEEPMVAMADIIEDELILALPDVPMHSQNECSEQSSRQFGLENQKELYESANSGSEAGDTNFTGNDRKNPFAVLKQLKTKPEN